MRPENYGLVFTKGEFKYFTKYKIVTEKQGTQHIEVTLAVGGTRKIHRYYDKKRSRWSEAIEAIHRYPAETINTEETNED